MNATQYKNSGLELYSQLLSEEIDPDTVEVEWRAPNETPVPVYEVTLYGDAPRKTIYIGPQQS